MLGLLRTFRPDLSLPRGRLWGAALAHLALVGLVHLVSLGGPGGLARAQEGEGGGLVGFALGSGLRDALGSTAALVLLLVGLSGTQIDLNLMRRKGPTATKSRPARAG